MSVGFGFSAGDFIAALNLVTTVLKSLRDAGGSSAEYQSLISQLYALETALLRVKQLEVDDSQYAEVIALRQAASQCQRTIDDFLKTVEKYQPSLRAGGSRNRVKDGWRMMKWAVCKSDDLAKFKADLMGHTESIGLLMMAIQSNATQAENHKHDNNHRTLVGKVQDSYFGCMQGLGVVAEKLSCGIQQGHQLLEMAANIVQTNVKIFNIVLNIQTLISRLPAQVERQQPVFLIDALGRHTPFHLEFITCAEALTAVLKINFKNIGPGPLMIERGDFAIQDIYSKRDIDLSSHWESCFSPGQNVGMSMIFVGIQTNIDCPSCHTESAIVSDDQDIEWQVPIGSLKIWFTDEKDSKCGMTYRRCGVQVPINSNSLESEHKSSLKDGRLSLNKSSEVEDKPIRPPTRKVGQADEITLFRRVRIEPFTPLQNSDENPNPQTSTRRKLSMTKKSSHDVISNDPSTGMYSSPLKSIRTPIPLRPRAVTNRSPSYYHFASESTHGPPLSMSAYFQQQPIIAPSYPPPSPNNSYMRYAATPSNPKVGDYFVQHTTQPPPRPLSARFDAMPATRIMEPITRTASAFGTRDMNRGFNR